ncbi:MAG: cytochrome c [Terrimicrobiaceae bacterium]
MAEPRRLYFLSPARSAGSAVCGRGLFAFRRLFPKFRPEFLRSQQTAMLKYFFIIFGFLVLVVIAMAGFRGHKSGQPPIEIFPDMDHQPKVKAQTPSNFFADRRAARPPVEGTVPIGYAMPMHKLVDGSVGQATGPYKQIYFSSSPTYFDTGKMGENWGTGIPYEVSPAVMQRGQQRYGIYCSVCHGATGAGNGMAQKFGLNTVQSLLQDRIRVMSDGEIFNTVTHGKNTMMAYGDRVQVIDRWAIVAYLRALQKSQGGATVADVPPEERAQLESKKQ